jgi:hypothetical protein
MTCGTLSSTTAPTAGGIATCIQAVNPNASYPNSKVSMNFYTDGQNGSNAQLTLTGTNTSGSSKTANIIMQQPTGLIIHGGTGTPIQLWVDNTRVAQTIAIDGSITMPGAITTGSITTTGVITGNNGGNNLVFNVPTGGAVYFNHATTTPILAFGTSAATFYQPIVMGYTAVPTLPANSIGSVSRGRRKWFINSYIIQQSVFHHTCYGRVSVQLFCNNWHSIFR